MQLALVSACLACGWAGHEWSAKQVKCSKEYNQQGPNGELHRGMVMWHPEQP